MEKAGRSLDALFFRLIVKILVRFRRGIFKVKINDFDSFCPFLADQAQKGFRTQLSRLSSCCQESVFPGFPYTRSNVRIANITPTASILIDFL